MFTHNLDPVLFDLGFLSIRWYSLAYIFGILLGWWYGRRIILKITESVGNKFNLLEFDNLITFLIISIIIGGRLGYVIFYNPQYFISSPLDIFKIWQGGMSFHGAMIGIIIGTYFFTEKKYSSLISTRYYCVCIADWNFFGRIANFINGELVGKVTSVSWSVIFQQQTSA